MVIPSKGREQVKKMLHQGHPRIDRMKRLAEGYMWWPGVDQELEECVKTCGTCQINHKILPVLSLHLGRGQTNPGHVCILIIVAHHKSRKNVSTND